MPGRGDRGAAPMWKTEANANEERRRRNGGLVRGDPGGEPRAAAAELRPRRRCLRDRRRARRADGRARGGAARLVGGGIGGRAGSPARHPVATPVLCCRAFMKTSTAWSSASGSITPSSCGRCPSAASITSSARSRKPACPASIRRPAGCTSPRPTTAGRSPPRSSACAGSAPRSRPGRRSACARRCRTDAISARCIFPAPSTSIRSITRSALPPTRKNTAPAYSRIRRSPRSTPPACASASRRKVRACAPTMWCLPATCSSAS